MAVDEIHVGDIGTVFRATVKEGSAVLNISNAAGYTTRQLKFGRPNGTSFTKPATLTTDGTDGQMQYTTVAGDLDTAGEWTVQGFIQSGSGQQWHTDKSLFTVHPNLS